MLNNMLVLKLKYIFRSISMRVLQICWYFYFLVAVYIYIDLRPVSYQVVEIFFCLPLYVFLSTVINSPYVEHNISCPVIDGLSYLISDSVCFETRHFIIMTELFSFLM
jgi:hypothetical protein